MRARLVPLLMLFSGVVHAQKKELWLNAGSGLFHLKGRDVYDQTMSWYSSFPSESIGSEGFHYGGKTGSGFSLSASGQRVTKGNFIYGLEAGYEQFSSKQDISQVWTLPDIYSSSFVKTEGGGKVLDRYSFINLHPYVGWRIKCGKVNVDVSAGIDYAFCTSYKQLVKATVAGKKVNDKEDRTRPVDDIRPRLQLNINYKRFGIYGGYSWGLNNYATYYRSELIYSFQYKPDARARLARFGVQYRLF